MLTFSSKREKWLWVWVAFIVITLYATLAEAPRIFKILQDHDLISTGFFFGMFLIILLVLVQGLKRKLNITGFVVAIGVVAVYLLLFLRYNVPSARSHMLEYSVVAIFIYEALLERQKNLPSFRRPELWAFSLSMLIGFIDECIQYLLPNRVFDWFDIFFNFVAIVLAVGGSFLLQWAQRRWKIES